MADYFNNKIRKITPSGVVSTLAGSGTAGYEDGIGVNATFNRPEAICVDINGYVYVTEFSPNIRKISSLGIVTTLDGTGYLSSPTGICIDSDDHLFVADCQLHKLFKISSAGVITTYAGSGEEGSSDGVDSVASFKCPWGICTDGIGNIYVADANDNKIRKVNQLGTVTTLAGSGILGATDGTGNNASFYNPHGVYSDATGNIYVADTWNHKIRKISAQGDVTTFAGSGMAGSTDTTCVTASFNVPHGICIGASGEVYVADFNNHKIRKITNVITSINKGLAFSAKVQVYPNPVTSLLTIKSEEPVEFLKIYDAVGLLVQSENQSTFSVSRLLSGFYFIQVKTTSGNRITRFVKE